MNADQVAAAAAIDVGEGLLVAVLVNRLKALQHNAWRGSGYQQGVELW